MFLNILHNIYLKKKICILKMALSNIHSNITHIERINYFVIYTIDRSNTLVTKKYVFTLFSIRPFHNGIQ